MNASTCLKELLRTCSDLDLRVRVEPVDPVSTSRGGLCRLRGKATVVLDSGASDGERAAILAEVLATYRVDASTFSHPVQMLIGLMRRRQRRLARRVA